jgi:outer membrane lipoprotein SlyB
MKKENIRQTKIILIVIMACFQLTGCASPKPVLYPNAYLKSVGQTQANQDIAECQEIAEEHVSASNTGKNIAKSTAMGAGMGAAGGAVGGIISGSAGSGSAVGAAAGATIGLIRGLFRGTEPNRTFQNFVDSCLRDRGYESAGWN